MLDGQRVHRMQLEDGEPVVLLRGARKRRVDRYGKASWRSAEPHAGEWGPGTGYVLVPSDRATNRRAKLALEFDASLENRSGDVEVLLLGPIESIERLITSGPTFCRARRRRTMNPEQLAAATLRLREAAEKRPPTT